MCRVFDSPARDQYMPDEPLLYRSAGSKFVFSVMVACAVEVERWFDSTIVWEQHKEGAVQFRDTKSIRP